MKKSVIITTSVFFIMTLFAIVSQAGAEESNINSYVHTMTDKVSISGTIEVEVGFENGFNDEDSSDISLATAELGIDAEIIEWASGHLLLSWDDEEDLFEVDEAIITLGNTEKIPIYLAVGKMYVPFGNFETNMVSDPLTKEIGETREVALQVGAEISGFYGSVYTFNGYIDEDGEEDEIRCFGANAGYAFESGAFSIDIGSGWINNIADTDGLGDEYEGAGLILKEYEGGFSVYAIAGLGPFMLIGEYVAAMDDIEFRTETREAPVAWNLEAGFAFEAMGREIGLTIGCQGTENCVGMLPENRCLGSVGIALCDGLGIALEYAHDEDYDVNDGGTGDDANIVTVQLAIEF